MSNFFNKQFLFGFIVGILTMIFLNIYQIYGMKHPPCHHCMDGFGFPFSFYTEMHAPFVEDKGVTGYSILGIVLNIIVTLIVSFIVGSLFKFAWSKIASQKLK